MVGEHIILPPSALERISLVEDTFNASLKRVVISRILGNMQG